MLSDNACNIINAVIVTLPKDKSPSENEILDLATRFKAIFPVTDDELERIIHELHSRYQITMDVGTAIISKEHQSWLPARKPEIVPHYWNRYETFLLKNEEWSPKVTTTLSVVTDEILDLLGNPAVEGPWKRRGLVMGDVQSGKTATYIALCCKAADAGYKLIILLTGTLENLRSQTQERLDEGFVGFDSSGLLSKQRENKAIGVGTIDPRHKAGVFTSSKKDFSSVLMNQLGFSLSSFKDPVLVVVKKNQKILENLESWLHSYNADNNGHIDIPMLLIDDEADNASVNTKSLSDPTTINKRIRSLLKLFVRSNYVGFTATPFANIFIDPDSDLDMIGDDLFPRDFIYALEPPKNYIGAAQIYRGRHEKCLRKITDASEIFPIPHKSDLEINLLPSSLEKAVNTFIITNAIRDLRGEGKTHRSMLVNVSRFTNIQDQVAALLEEKVLKIQQDIRNYSQLNPQEACQNYSIASLKKTWEEEFSCISFEWELIQRSLTTAALPIVVKSVNQRSKAKRLDYRANKLNGLRVIAVGGNSLSRGLTLEGLCTSYFYRNSQMYDTLMQMGRWFGYRGGYEDLCRVWMSGEAILWYKHISAATDELREEIRKMQKNGLTPEEFGLKVRAHPDSLIVTARNKMKATKTIERLISLSGEGPETPRLHTDPSIIRANARVVESMIKDLGSAGYMPETSPFENTIWKGVPKEYIISLLRKFNIHLLNYSFQGESISSFLENNDEIKLSYWDIVIPNGHKKQASATFAGFQYYPQERSVEYRGKSILVSGSSARVGYGNQEREGMSEEKVSEAETAFRVKAPKRSIPGKAYRKYRERPLLLLHLLKANIDGKSFDTGGAPLIALGLSLPEFSNSNEKKVKYQVNMVQWRNYFETEIDDDTEDEDEIV